MTKNDLALRKESALLAELSLDDMLTALMGVGTDNIQSDDIILPKLLLLQPTSPLASEGDNRPGHLVDSISGTNYGTSAAFYVVLAYGSRTKWQGSETDSDDISSPIECSSQDGMTGSKFGSCATCPFSQWKNVPGGKSIRPACTEFKNLLVVPASDVTSIPLSFSAKRTGIKAVRELLSAFAYQRGPIFMCETVISTVKQKNEQGTWYTPKFAKGNRVPDVATLTTLMEVNKRLKESQDRLTTRPQDEHVEGGAARTDDLDGDDAAF